MPIIQDRMAIYDNSIFIKDRRVCFKPLRNRLQAIQKLQPTTTAKGCRSFAGMVNFLSMFCPQLQKLLKPIYDLTRKGRRIIWGEEQEYVFEENSTGRFHLHSDTSKFATGSTLYQLQNGKPMLIIYASKRLPEAAKITPLQS